MATSQIEPNTGADKFKVAIALALVLGGFAGYFVLSSQSDYVRWAVLIACLLLGVVVFMFSGAGRSLYSFAQDSEREVRKVVWPTRKETLQTTLFVFVFVLLMATFLWLVDKGLDWVFFSLLLGWR